MNYLYFGALRGSLDEATSKIEKECGRKVEQSPDIHLFLSDEQSFGVDLAKEVEEILKNTPFFEKHYIILSDFAKATADCQDMLLKSLEDEENADFYLLCSSENVLPTVKSRCKCINPVRSYEEYLRLYKGKYPLEAYFITGGECLDPEEDLVDIFLGVKEALSSNGQKLFSVLHLVKEKDKEAFSTRFPAYILSLIRYITRLLSEDGKDASALMLSLDELTKAKKAGYSKDNFFCFIANLAFCLDGGKKK